MNKSKKFAAGGGIYEPKELQPSRQQKLSEKDGFRTTDELQPQKQLKPRTGTTEGTDQGSAERNLRLMYDEMKADERQRKAREQYDKDKAKNFKKGGRVKRYADGGEIASQQPTYPFYGNTPQPSTTQPGVAQTFNIQPQATNIPPTQMKKGGKVSSASKRADGCATKGKTRGRMV